MSTIATDLTPLQILVGKWQGQSGKDLSPEPDGTETNIYREQLEFKPTRPFSNAEEQRMLAVQYHQVVYRIKDNKQIHDQSGYFSWDAVNEQLVHSFTIPRGVAVIAGGTCTVDQSNQYYFDVAASIDNEQWPITQTGFMHKKARTLSFRQNMWVKGSELRYEQTTVVDIYGKQFEHTDSNTLVRVDLF